MEKISIIVNAYNGNEYIEKCLRSILAQNLHNKYDLEIIVSYFEELDTNVPTVVEAIKDVRVKLVPIHHSRFSFRTFLNAGFEMISEDSKYIHFMSALSYFVGTELLYNCVSKITEDDEIIMFRRFLYARNMTDKPSNNTSPDLVITCIDEVLYSLTFLNRKDIVDIFAPYFSVKHSISLSDYFVGITNYLVNAIEELNPILMDIDGDNAVVEIRNKDNWYREFLTYYFAVEQPDLTGISLDNLENIYGRLPNFVESLRSCFADNVSIYDIKANIDKNIDLSEKAQRLFRMLLNTTFIFSIDSDL